MATFYTSDRVIPMRLLSLLVMTWVLNAAPLELSGLKLRNVKAESVTYKGRSAIRVSDPQPEGVPDGARLAMVNGAQFENGVIEVDLAGDTAPGADPIYRGFTGISFHVEGDGVRHETIYLRPKNGRSEDQLQRNHSVQYMAFPDWPWQKLREETPGKYESYVDLVPGEWTKVKIVVQGEKARLYVGGAEQPVLVVNDLKHGKAGGGVALFVGPGTVAHFANLKIATDASSGK
jgi:hypothetical protein